MSKGCWATFVCHNWSAYPQTAIPTSRSNRVCLDCVLAEPEKSPKLTELQLDINLESLNSPLEPIFSNLSKSSASELEYPTGLIPKHLRGPTFSGQTSYSMPSIRWIRAQLIPGPGSRHIYLEGLSSLTPFLRVDIFTNIQRNPNWSQFERYRVLELSPLLQHSREMVRFASHRRT